jgi:hypothetical protein
MFKLVVLIAVFSIAQFTFAAPQGPPPNIVRGTPVKDPETEYRENDGSGNFKYGFKTLGGIQQDVEGTIVDQNGRSLNAVEQSGSFSFTHPDGRTFNKVM